MKVIVTGFEAFDRMQSNPSADLLALLPDEIRGDYLVTRVLPVDTDRIEQVLRDLPQENVRAVLHLGLATDRPVISIERIALNLRDFSRPDNGGNKPVDALVRPGGPLALRARWPVKSTHAAWAENGIEAAISTSAGTFLCNQALYLSLADRPDWVSVGFVHVTAHQPLEVQARAVVLAIEGLHP